MKESKNYEIKKDKSKDDKIKKDMIKKDKSKEEKNKKDKIKIEKSKEEKYKKDKIKKDIMKKDKSKNKTHESKDKNHNKSHSLKFSKMDHVNNNDKKNKEEINMKKKETTLYMFYMTHNEISARQIYELIGDNEEFDIELWDAMNILQIELPNKNTTDFELIDTSYFKESSDQAFIKNRKIKTIFTVTTESEDFIMLKPIFKSILEKYEGFICTDSDDFNPIYNNENL